MIPNEVNHGRLFISIFLAMTWYLLNNGTRFADGSLPNQIF